MCTRRLYCYSPSLLHEPCRPRVTVSLWTVEIFTLMHFSSCHTVRVTVSRSSVTVAELEKRNCNSIESKSRSREKVKRHQKTPQNLKLSIEGEG